MAAKILLSSFAFGKSKDGPVHNHRSRSNCCVYKGQVENVVASDAKLSSQKLEREIKLACFSAHERKVGVCLASNFPGINQTMLFLHGKLIDGVITSNPQVLMTLEGNLHGKEEGKYYDLLKIPISTSLSPAKEIISDFEREEIFGVSDLAGFRSAMGLDTHVPLYLANLYFQLNLGAASSVKWIWFMSDIVLTVQLPKVEIGTEVDLSMARVSLNKMLVDNEHSDLTIVAVDGTEIKCQKCFLTVHSDSFKAMLAKESESMESQVNRIELEEMSGAGVKAFLQFLYSFDTTAPKSNGFIALELLKASDKYNIKPLEAAMTRLFLSWPAEWQEMETVAIHLFSFTREADELKQLKNLAVGVLKSRSKELVQLESFNDLFKKDIPAVKELFVLFFSN